jgi:tetratricopeptide (TPR) repeat protein
LKLPFVLALGVVLAIAPVTLRNYLVTDEFMLISSQGGVNLYLGNNVVANGLFMTMPEMEIDESSSWREFVPMTRAVAEREAGHELTPAQESSFWTQKAVHFMREHPGQFLSLVWKKSLYLLSGFENSDNMDVYHERTKSVVYSLLFWHTGIYVPFGLLLPLALMGTYLRRRDTKKLTPIYLFIIAYIPSIVLFLVTARHRLALIPFLILLAAAGVITLFNTWRTLARKERVIAIGVFVVALVLFNRTFYEAGGYNEFQIHFNEGIKYERLGNFESAEREYLLADQENPYSPSLINNLAHAQYQLGKHNEAARNFERVVGMQPTYGRALNNYGLLVRDQEMLDSALLLFRKATQHYDTLGGRQNELGQVYLNIAGVYERIGIMDSAAANYLRALEVSPLLGKSYYLSAAFFARQEAYELSDSLFGRGQHVREPEAPDLFNWGLSYVERRMFSAGMTILQRAIKRDPDLYQAYYVVAVCHLEGGSPRDSVAVYLNRCLTLSPNYEPALRLKKSLE